MLSYIWVGMAVISLVFGVLSGTSGKVAAALFDGPRAAVDLTISICGIMMLWSGILEVMRRSSLSERLAGLLRPLIARLFPACRGDRETVSSIAENMTANLLGLGNAATPAGLRAVRGMVRLSGRDAGDDMCRLVVLNTASVQLIPATVAAVRSAAGAASPFDILPAVWITSAVSVAAGLCAAEILRRLWPA